VETLPTTTAQPVKSDKILDVDKLTALQIDKQYNVAKGTEQTARFAAFPEKIQVEHQLAGPMPAVADKTVKIIPETNVTATMPVKQAVPQITGTAGPNVPLQSEKQANVPISPASVTSKELDIDLQLSQPQPVTARVTVAAATGSNRSAAPVHESGDTGRQYSSEQQIERVRTATDRRDVKEMASSLQSITADSESMSGTGTSLEGETNQGQADVDSGDQMLTQNLRLSTDHQKVSPVTARSISNEPAVPDTTEQVLQQVKERLMKHDVKPGNQQITLTLSPDSLGELKMNLNLQGQKLSVEIVTENKTVRDAIVHHTEALRESLARQNITMESFDVTTGGKGSGGQGQNQSAWREMVKQQQQQQFWSSSRNYQTSQANLEPGLATYQKQQGESMLDIHY
jgi:flagellar hook-length control protein FliK